MGKICSRMVNNEVQFYEGGNFEAIAHKLHLAKVESYSLSPTNAKSCHVVAYVSGAKGAPSFCRLYQFPLFADHQLIAKLAEAAIPVQKRAGDQAEALAAAANHAKEIKEQTYQGARGILADPQREKKARKVMDKLAKINKLKEEA